MKIMLPLLLALTAIAACALNGSSPSNVAGKWLQLVSHKKFEEAKEYSTSNTAMMLDWMKNFPDDEHNRVPDFTILRDSIAGDRAWVFWTEKAGNKEQILDMAKVDGKWKVNITMRK